MKKVFIFIAITICIILYFLNKDQISFLGDKYKLEHSQMFSSCRLNQYFMAGKNRERAENFIDILSCPQTISFDEYKQTIINNYQNSDMNNNLISFSDEKISDDKLLLNVFVNKESIYQIPMHEPIVKKYVSGTYVIIHNVNNKDEMHSYSIEKRYYLENFSSIDDIYVQIEKDKVEVNKALKKVKMPRMIQHDFHRKIR